MTGSAATSCVGDDEALALLDGTASEEARLTALAHADGCPQCYKLLAALVRAGGDEPSPDSDLNPIAPLRHGDHIGRFVVRELLGAGGMGEVYAADDPQLGRRVALKILRDAPLGDRLLREAQALARLAHPNVVPVFDAGSAAGRVFVAMELVSGETFRGWSLAATHGWRGIVAVMTEAGRGLAAAHEAGIVHRDFKPDNVLVGDDRRVRVVDFGLAFIGAAAANVGRRLASPATGTLTRAGAILGTPAYMAPEQLRGETATPASDQFSFCVTLYEGLFGERPFIGRSVSELLASVERGLPVAVAGKRRVPRWIRSAVWRGLAPRAEERWPSMAALLAALSADPARWRRPVLGVVAAALAVGGAFLVRPAPDDPRAAACRGAGTEIAGLWSDGRKRVMKQAMLAGTASYADQAWRGLEQGIDGYVARWSDTYTAACDATHVRGTQSQELLDRRVSCLDGQRQELRAVLDVFSQPSPRLAEQASRALAELPALERCSAEATLHSRVLAPPAALSERVSELRRALAGSRALLRGGQYDASLAAAGGLAAAAGEIGYAPLEADALVALGSAQRQRRRFDEALATYERALRAATSGGDDRLAGEALAALGWLTTVHRGAASEAVELLRHAASLAERIGDERLAAEVSFNEGVARTRLEEHEAARAAFERSLAIRERIYGADSTSVATVLEAIGRSSRVLGRPREARLYLERAIAMAERTRGPGHPSSAIPLNNLGNLLQEDFGDYDGALALYRRALPLYELRGKDTPEVALVLVNMARVTALLGDDAAALRLAEHGLAIHEGGQSRAHAVAADAHVVMSFILDRLGRFDEAKQEAQRALDIWTERGSGESVAISAGYEVLARAESGLGHKDAALAAAERAVALVEAKAPPGGPGRITPWIGLCRALLAVDRPEEARTRCLAALDLARDVFGAMHPWVAEAQLELARAELARGRADVALPHLEAARAFLESRPGDPALRARARTLYARVLESVGYAPVR